MTLFFLLRERPISHEHRKRIYARDQRCRREACATRVSNDPGDPRDHLMSKRLGHARRHGQREGGRRRERRREVQMKSIGRDLGELQDDVRLF